jgi:hypothetical protein
MNKPEIIIPYLQSNTQSKVRQDYDSKNYGKLRSVKPDIYTSFTNDSIKMSGKKEKKLTRSMVKQSNKQQKEGFYDSD